MYPSLVLDEDFYAEVSKYEAQLFKVSKTISNVLLVHKGPILNFSFIPKDQPLSLNMDHWIKNISYKGIREFELHNNALISCRIPSYSFSCLELTHLSLVKCISNPPLGFRGFFNLTSVRLENVAINTDMKIIDSGEIDWRWFECTQKVKKLVL